MPGLICHPCSRPHEVLEYLSRYTHRVAISNSRILSFSEHQVTFKWRDYADDNRVKHSSIEATEFLRRFLMHVLPPRFVKIRYFGFLANRKRGRKIELIRTLLGCAAPLRFRERPRPLILCPLCHAARYEGLARVRPPPRSESAA